MDKPLPCPYCGEPEQIFVHPMETRAGVLRFVTCIVCDCRGPYDHTPEEAIAAWNRRAPWTVTRERAQDALIAALEGADIPLPPDKASRLFSALASGHNPFDDGARDMVEALGGKVEG